MATIYSEDFNTLNNGDPPPPPWVPNEGTSDIQSHALRVQTGAAAYNSAKCVNNAAQPLIYEMRYDATITTVTASEFYGAINVRAGSSSFTDIKQWASWHCLFVGDGSGTTGYTVLYRISAAGASTFLTGGGNIGFVQGSVLHVRVRVSGNVFKIRYWKDAESEPAPWNIDYDDGANAPQGTGMSFAVRAGASATADRWDFDNIVIDDLSTGSTMAWTEDEDTVAGIGVTTIVPRWVDRATRHTTSRWKAKPKPSFIVGGPFGSAETGGPAVWTEDEDTVAATGTQLTTAAIAFTEDGDTIAAAGSETRGTIAFTNDDDTIVGAGTFSSPGSAAWTEDEDTVAALGVSGGSIAFTEDGDTIAAAGTWTLSSALAFTEDDDVVAASGLTSSQAPIAWTEDDDSFVGAGSSTTGALVFTEDDDTVVGAGGALRSGDLVWTEDDDRMVVEIMVSTQLFRLVCPTVEGERTLSEAGRLRQGVSREANSLAARFHGTPVAQSVLKIAGTYHTINGPTVDQINAATEYYPGGHDNYVNATVGAALVLAGYTVEGL